MKLRDLVIRISGMVLFVTIIFITLFGVAYSVYHHEYTYVKDGKFYKSNKCYVEVTGEYRRICEKKGQKIEVEMYYEEER